MFSKERGPPGMSLSTFLVSVSRIVIALRDAWLCFLLWQLMFIA